MGKYFAAIAVVAFLCSCGSHQKNTEQSASTTNTEPGYLKTSGDSVTIPSLVIALELSQKATEHLASAKESIVVNAWFSGHPKDTSSKEYKESGGIFLKTAHAELVDSIRIVKFEGLSFAKSLYDSLADKDIRVLVNVYSGRKTAADNILDCTILSDKMSAVKDKSNVLHCRLINEADSLQ